MATRGAEFKESEGVGAADISSIEFLYKISQNYAVYAASGVQGGLTPHGDILLNFFYERASIPRTQRIELLPNGSLGDIIDTEKKSQIIRDIFFGISINPNIAKSLIKWLQARIDTLESINIETETQENGKDADNETTG